MGPFRITVLLSFLLLISLSGCDKDKNVSGDVLNIQDIKTKSVDKYIGKLVKIKGFYVNKPKPMLVSDLKWLDINMPIPEGEYILLSGKGVESISAKKYYGAEVVLSGRVGERDVKNIKLMRKTFGSTYGMEFICPDLPKIIKHPINGYMIPEIYPLCRLNPKLCGKPPFLFKRKYALLLSGGANAANAHVRYWNDLKFMYNTLRTKYGFSDANIVVVYKDGSAEDTDMTVDFAANTNGLDDAFKYLRDRMTKRDDILIFVTNHGGGYSMDLDPSQNDGGIVDVSGDESDEAIFESHIRADLNGDGDQDDHIRYDEITYLYDDASNLTDDDFAKYVNSLKYYRNMTIILEPCFSGGNIADLRGPRRVIMSAASEYEYSWGGGPGNHDEFSYYVTAALAGQTHDGTVVNADSNGNGKISMLEAFLYAQDNDSKPETPFYEDNGDGRGHTGPFPIDGDGIFGAAVSLN